MSDAIARLEARLDGVERALASLELRLEALETTAGVPAAAQAAAAPLPSTIEIAPGLELAPTLALVGRTLVIFAGAYLLRALTESGALGTGTGVAIGLAYAAAWTLVAFRVGGHRQLSATFFGACTVLLGLPLLWEATNRFALLSPDIAVTALAAMTALVLLVAWRRRLHALAWVATIGAGGLAALILVFGGATLGVTVFLVLLGLATCWLGYDLEWKLLRGLSAACADLAVAGLAGRAMTTPPRDQPAAVIAVQVLLLAGYLGSFAVRTLVRGRNVVPFEISQTVALLVVGLVGAMAVALETGTGTTALGAATLVLAAASYAVAFAFVDRQQGRGANFHFYASLALVFVLSGSLLVLGTTFDALFWGLLALLAGWAGVRFDRRALVAHSVVYVAAAALAGGLLGAFATGLLGSPATAWPPVAAVTWVVLAAVFGCFIFASALDDGAGRAAQWALACLAAAGCAGVVLVVLRPFLPSAIGSPLHPAAVATLRTGVLSAAAILVAVFGRRKATGPFGPLLYPILAAGALKLLLEDVRTSPPALLFVALALYGGALILGPRIARARSSGTPAGESA